jgi:uncharacterized membrane protein YfcA
MGLACVVIAVASFADCAGKNPNMLRSPPKHFLRRAETRSRRPENAAAGVTGISFALASHALAGMLTRQVALATAIALPLTIGGAWLGAYIYRRLADGTYQRAVLLLLLISAVTLIWTSW